MKQSNLKRLEVLERNVRTSLRSLLCLIEVHRLPSDDREAFWDGDDAVLTRYGLLDVADSAYIRAVVISVHPNARDRWQATAGMDDEDLERFEQAAIFQEQIQEREEREARERAAMEAIRATRPRAVIGYDREGNPIYDDALGVTANWGD